MSSMLLWQILHCKIKQRSKKRKKKTWNCSGSKAENLRQAVSHAYKVKTESYVSEYQSTCTCRVCLKPGDIPIYGCVDVSEELLLFTGIEVKPDDAYPQYLCDPCNAVLESAIEFKKTAQNSDRLLKQVTQEDMFLEVSLDVETDSDDHKIWPEIETVKNETRKSTEEYSSDYDDESRQKNRKRVMNNKDTTTLDELMNEIGKGKDAKVKFEEVRTKTLHCVQCNINFDTMEEYSAHRLSAEHDELRRTCPICNNTYTPAYLKKHLALHKKEKPYMCDICGKKFAIQGQFTRHRVTHFVIELPFKCSVCPYRGRFKENLKLHMRTHTNDKRYRCPQCPTRCFINKSNLSRHLLTHKTDHDFKCDQCQRGFYKKRDLELHFKVDHGGIKDHVCDLCGKAFGFRKQMMKHQLKVHKREKKRGGRTPLYLLLDSKKQYENSSSIQEANNEGCF